MSIRVIEPVDRQVKGCLEQVLSEADGLETVIVLGIQKNGKQYLRTSAVSQMEKCFLLQFFTAWVTGWFAFGDE